MSSEDQIQRLADFITQEIPGEPSRSEGAGDTAIRLLREFLPILQIRHSSNLVAHARCELELSGQYAEDPEYSESIIRAVQGFVSFGHSGGSASVAIDQLTRLLRYENLAPLTDNPREWIDRSGASGGFPLWQNVRNSRAMSRDGGKTYTLVEDDNTDAIYHSQPASVLPPT